MTDIILETIRALVLLGIVVFLWNAGRGRFQLSRQGWNFIIWGFGLLLFGSVLDITDNFKNLNRFVVIGDTEAEAFLEKFVGFLGGFSLLAIGLIRWIPKVQNLSDLVEDRTRELHKANELLVGEIAERKEAEEQIKASLKEKEILLREIHHRVKNNLQVISSLLSLQASIETDNRTIKALKESQRRVGVMARIHETLHQSDDLASINARDYLSTLVEDTKVSSGQSAQGISFRLRADDIIFDVDHAIPCGQIISELLSNSLKHAFPKGQSGNIEVSLHRRDGGKIELAVADDGKGLPEGFDIQQSETLGMRLVSALAMQLNGVVEVDCSGGTRVQITFPEKPS